MTLSKLKHKSAKWIEGKILYFAEQDAELNTFRTFECSKYFRGEHLARLNWKYYCEQKAYIDRKIRQLELLMENMKED